MSDIFMNSLLLSLFVVFFFYWIKIIYILLIGKTYGGYVIYLIYNKETKATSTKILCFTLVLRTFDKNQIIKEITEYMEDKANEIMEERGRNPKEDITVLSIELIK